MTLRDSKPHPVTHRKISPHAPQQTPVKNFTPFKLLLARGMLARGRGRLFVDRTIMVLVSGLA